MSAQLDPATRAMRVLSSIWVLAATGSWVIIGTRKLAALALMVRHPLHEAWWPELFTAPALLAVLDPLTLTLALAATLWPRPTVQRTFAWTLVLFGAVVLLHQSYNSNAAGVVAFWAGLWAVWLTHVPPRGLRHGPFLALLVLGGLYLFPVLGKLTPGYWTGELYLQMHWAHGQGLIGWLKDTLGPAALAPVARVYGPMSLAIEGLLALVWILPSRLGFPLVLAGLLGMLGTGGLPFVGVLGMIAALAAAGWTLAEDPRLTPRAPEAPRPQAARPTSSG